MMDSKEIDDGRVSLCRRQGAEEREVKRARVRWGSATKVCEKKAARHF
jgi:hypothetical protein